MLYRIASRCLARPFFTELSLTHAVLFKAILYARSWVRKLVKICRCCSGLTQEKDSEITGRRGVGVSTSGCRSEGRGFESHPNQVDFCFQPWPARTRVGSAMCPVRRMRPYSRATATLSMSLFEGCPRWPFWPTSQIFFLLSQTCLTLKRSLWQYRKRGLRLCRVVSNRRGLPWHNQSSSSSFTVVLWNLAQILYQSISCCWSDTSASVSAPVLGVKPQFWSKPTTARPVERTKLAIWFNASLSHEVVPAERTKEIASSFISSVHSTCFP